MPARATPTRTAADNTTATTGPTGDRRRGARRGPDGAGCHGPCHCGIGGRHGRPPTPCCGAGAKRNRRVAGSAPACGVVGAATGGGATGRGGGPTGRGAGVTGLGGGVTGPDGGATGGGAIGPDGGATGPGGAIGPVGG